MSMDAGAYPVTYDVETQPVRRNRLTTAFRIILAIPHLIVVGGPGIFGGGWPAGTADGDGSRNGSGGGSALGTAAFVMAVLSWFAIVFTGKQPRGLWDFTRFFLTWRSKAVAYTALLRDEYPPFGDGEYPVTFGVGEFPETRDRLRVGFRLILAIPQFIVLLFISIAWVMTAIIGWFAILFTGAYPEGLYRFAVGYLRWSLRVESYVLLMHDEYPPFSLD